MTEDNAYKYLKKTGSIFVRAIIIVNNSLEIHIDRYHSFNNARKAFTEYMNSGYNVGYINKTQAEKMGWFECTTSK